MKKTLKLKIQELKSNAKQRKFEKQTEKTLSIWEKTNSKEWQDLEKVINLANYLDKIENSKEPN